MAKAAYDRERRLENLETLRAYDRERGRSPERRAATIARGAEWRSRNRLRDRELKAEYKLRRRGADTATLDYARVLKEDPCAYCASVTESIDHVSPLVDGGLDHWTNLAPSCMDCNRRKHSMPLLSFLLAQAS